MRALVTGSEGFVGRHMVPALERAGWSVDTLDLLPAPPGRKHFMIDARLFFTCDDTRYDLVVHLAAVVGGRALIEGNPMSLAVDLSIDAEMFSWAMRTRPGRVVYFSSSAAYPVELQTAGARPLMEHAIDFDHVATPDLTYGWAKLTGEMLARHVRAAGVPVTVLRPFSGYGEDQALDYPFPSIIERVQHREDPLTVWGSGFQARDWVHIDDVVGCTLACIDQEVDGPLNICTGRATTFRQLALLAAAIAGYAPDIHALSHKPAGVFHRVGHPLSMRRAYEPTVTLEDGIARALLVVPA